MTNDVQPPPWPAGGPRRSGGSRAATNELLPWLVGAVIVLMLAVAGGLLTAWLVANNRAVPGPAAGLSPVPQPTPVLGASDAPSAGQPTLGPTAPPRRTPTPSPFVTTAPEPFVHIVERGESLTEIAALYQVELRDVVALNDIRNPDRIQVGQEILIPGYGQRP